VDGRGGCHLAAAVGGVRPLYFLKYLSFSYKDLNCAPHVIAMHLTDRPVASVSRRLAFLGLKDSRRRRGAVEEFEFPAISRAAVVVGRDSPLALSVILRALSIAREFFESRERLTDGIPGFYPRDGVADTVPPPPPSRLDINIFLVIIVVSIPRFILDTAWSVKK
jgi:hypothetical protein